MAAKSKLPNALERRHVLVRPLAPAQALRLADAYLAEGRTLEAVELLRKAGAAERLAALRQEAIGGGDYFLLRSVAAAAGEPVRRDEWLALASAAEAAGKQRYADDARRQAQRGKE